MFRRLIVAVVVLALGLGLLPAGAVAAAAPAYFVDQAKLPFDALPGTTTTRYWGVLNGAGYRIEVPQNWNGDLVLYAHGYRGTGLELTVSNPSLRAYLIGRGYAWAASSFGTNGYDVARGVEDTRALKPLFAGLVRQQPRRTYIMGHSMGGQIVGAAIERYRNDYAGALPMCGVMGDRALFDSFLDFQLVAQALTNNRVGYPVPANYQSEIVPQIKATLSANPLLYQFLLAAMKQRTGGERPLADVGFLIWYDILFALGGIDPTPEVPGPFPGNATTIYQLDSDPALSAVEQVINAGVQRIAAPPPGQQPASIPALSGDIPVPVLTLHGLGDMFVPFSMEQLYARRVATQGKGNLLVQRAIRDALHCGFTAAEEEQAFADLVTWVERGIKPAGDQILNPAAVADPRFGCFFTREQRFYAPAC